MIALETPTQQSHRHWWLIGIILLGALLRIYHLNASPLRGDEAFTVRYWTAAPAAVINLAAIEPHPISVMLSYGLWKTLAGDSEFAMRYPSALIDLIGIAAIYGLGRRLLNDGAIGLIAALLWAVNPYQLWHAQDARDYAIWAALSIFAMWLLACAADRRRPIDWLLYGLGAVAALYSFFMESFLIPVGALYLLFRRQQVWRSWLVVLIGISPLLLPWLAQVWALAHSGYHGTAATASLTDLPRLITQFLPALLMGEANPVLYGWWPLLVVVLASGICFLIVRGRPAIALFLLSYATIPAILLMLVATRIAVFQPRYLLAATPPLLLLASCGLKGLFQVVNQQSRSFSWGMVGLLTIIFIGAPLNAYSQSHKAPDWFGLRDYLAMHVHPDDLIVLTTLDPNTGGADPAFAYYYRGTADVITLPRTGSDSAATIRVAASHYRALWFVPSGGYAAEIDQALRENTQPISDEGAGGGLIVREFRALTRKPTEIEMPRVIRAGAFALRGFSLERSAQHLTVILFWMLGSRTPDTVFVHLIGTINPASGSPLWAQHDHPPLTASRDVYTIDLTGVPAGHYRIEIGLYDPATGIRRTLTDENGSSVGDSALLSSFDVSYPQR